MLESFCKEKAAPLVLRLTLGGLCVYHGYLKIMAAGGTTWYPGMPTGWQLFISWGEFAAGLAILLGFRCRLAAGLALAATAASLWWWQGWNILRLPMRSLEQPLLLLIVALVLLFLGAGELSLDGWKGANLSPARRAGRG